MPTPGELFIGLILGSIGLGYFVYGRRSGRLVVLVCGVLLMVFPYFVAGIWPQMGIGVVLDAAALAVSLRAGRAGGEAIQSPQAGSPLPGRAAVDRAAQFCCSIMASAGGCLSSGVMALVLPAAL